MTENINNSYNYEIKEDISWTSRCLVIFYVKSYEHMTQFGGEQNVIFHPIFFSPSSCFQLCCHWRLSHKFDTRTVLHSLLVLFIHPNYFSGCPPRMCLDDVDLLCEIIMLKMIHPITLKPSSLSHFKHTHDPHCSILYMCVALFKRPTTFWSLVDSAPHLF